MDSLSKEYWNPELLKTNAEYNINKVERTISDFYSRPKKIMVCGRGTDKHPDFHPRFSTTSTDIESELYVLVDHTYYGKNTILRKGNYAISLIVHPLVPEKIKNVGGKIFWFSPDYLQNNLPKIKSGKYPKENSGLAAIALASYFGAENILLSGINLTTSTYGQFLEGKDIVFTNVFNRGAKIFSLDGILAEEITYEKWCKI